MGDESKAYIGSADRVLEQNVQKLSSLTDELITIFISGIRVA